MSNEILNNITNDASSIVDQILSALGGLMNYIQPVIAALAILVIGGWILKKIMGIINFALKKANVDELLNKVGLSDQLHELGFKSSATQLITEIIHWVAKFILWMAAINVLGITALTDLMNEIVAFIPNVLVAIILLLAGLVISKIAKEFVENTVDNFQATKGYAFILGKVVRVAIMVVAVMAALTQLNIAEEMVQTLFNGMVYTLTIALGLSLGLGGQHKAREIIDRLSQDK